MSALESSPFATRSPGSRADSPANEVTPIDEQDSKHQFGWFLALQATWFVAFGIQAVLFPYLVVHVLGETPERVGIAQMCVMAPALVLMLPGGMLADATDLRRLMALVQCLTAIPVGALALAIGRTEVAFGMLLVFALAHGSLQAMVVPARDALLSRVAGAQVQHAITTAMSVQFLCQMVGFALAGLAASLGPSTLLAVQGALYLAGGIFSLRLRPVPPLGEPRLPETHQRRALWGTNFRRFSIAALREHLAELPLVYREVVHSSRIGPVLAVMVGIGFCFISVFGVVVPIMVRDYYHGSSAALAMVNASFVLGVVLVTLAMRLRPAVRRQGKTIVRSAWGGTGLTAAFSLAPPMWSFYAFILAFGVFSGVIMSLGRTLVQESATPTRRARVLALYSLGFLGAAPVGSFAVGQVADLVGVLAAALLAAAAMALLLVLIGARTDIMSIESLTAGEERDHQ